MPITYEIDERASRVTLRFTGTITDADLMTAVPALYRDPRHRVGMEAGRTAWIPQRPARYPIATFRKVPAGA